MEWYDNKIIRQTREGAGKDTMKWELSYEGRDEDYGRERAREEKR